MTEITIESAVDTLIDYRGKTPTKSPRGVRLVTAKVIKRGRIENDPAEYIADDMYDAWMRRGLPQEGDALITTEAPLGEVARIGHDCRVALAQRVILLRANRDLVLPDFLYYALQSDYTQAGLAARATGTTVLGIKQSELRRVKIRVFPIPIQHRIAAILSAYDGLIDNNLKRIGILEEMARSLYREWFVQFRYPGNTSVPLVESSLGLVPQGWQIGPLLSLADAIYGFPFASQAFNAAGNGLPVVRIRDILAGESQTFTAQTPEPKHYIDDGAILVGMDGDFHIGAWCGGRAVQNQRVARLIPRAGGLSRGMLIQAIGEPIKVLNRQIVGATVAHLGDMHIRKITLPIAPAELREAAGRQLDAMFDLSLNLRKQSIILRRTRALLLPRLMSGTLSVADLTAAEAAVP